MLLLSCKSCFRFYQLYFITPARQHLTPPKSFTGRVARTALVTCVLCRACPICTSSYPQYSHDPDDGGVDGQCSTDLNFLQGDAHHWQEHNGQVQLVPPSTSKYTLLHWKNHTKLMHHTHTHSLYKFHKKSHSKCSLFGCYNKLCTLATKFPSYFTRRDAINYQSAFQDWHICTSGASLPHPQNPLINLSCAAKCLSDNFSSRLEDRWETDVSKSDESGRESVWSHCSHSDIWLQGNNLPSCNYTNIPCFSLSFIAFCNCFWRYCSPHLSSDFMEDSQSWMLTPNCKFFMEN